MYLGRTGKTRREGGERLPPFGKVKTRREPTAQLGAEDGERQDIKNTHKTQKLDALDNQMHGAHNKHMHKQNSDSSRQHAAEPQPRAREQERPAMQLGTEIVLALRAGTRIKQATVHAERGHVQHE